MSSAFITADAAAQRAAMRGAEDHRIGSGTYPTRPRAYWHQVEQYIPGKEPAMRRPTNNRRPRTADDVARYNLAVALLALVAALILAALVAPGAVSLQVVLPLLVPPLTLALRYFFERGSQ
jgi:hypothetical protein